MGGAPQGFEYSVHGDEVDHARREAGGDPTAGSRGPIPRGRRRRRPPGRDGSGDRELQAGQRAPCARASSQPRPLTVVPRSRQCVGPPDRPIGICLFPEDGPTGPELLKNADAAMYEAKQPVATRTPSTGAIATARPPDWGWRRSSTAGSSAATSWRATSRSSASSGERARAVALRGGGDRECCRSCKRRSTSSPPRIRRSRSTSPSPRSRRQGRRIPA